MLQENLKKYREEKGYSKLRLARETGLSARCIEHIEHGMSTNPQLKTLQKISKVLDVSIGDLIK